MRVKKVEREIIGPNERAKIAPKHVVDVSQNDQNDGSWPDQKMTIFVPGLAIHD